MVHSCFQWRAFDSCSYQLRGSAHGMREKMLQASFHLSSRDDMEAHEM